MRSPRKFSPGFKAKAASEALAGERTQAELSAKHDIHQILIQRNDHTPDEMYHGIISTPPSGLRLAATR